MAILEKEIVENQGLIKEFDEDSFSIMLDIVQKDIYSFPPESAVRESFSNAYDAVKEKKIALSILNRETKVEDHFETDDRIETKASIFDEGYYNKEYLDESDNKVRITYTVNEEDGKDIIAFRDFGVGLGGERLKGYMRPGYSSKRLSKDMLGKYGLGSKSALSTNIEYYVLESWYNGYYTKFMIYDKYYKCIISEKGAAKTEYIIGYKEMLVENEEGEEEIERVEVKEPIYWENTTYKNGVRLSFNVKAHNKNKFIDAVKKQLMYFGDHLIFEIIEDGVSYEPSFKATILHETELFIVSKNSYFSVPHILINNVNYSIIDFPELGMNKIFGSIAVKATSNDIDVAANRESVKWTDKTRNFIQTAITAASQEAGKLLESKLASIDNPVERYLTATNYQSSDDNDSELIKQLRSFGGTVRMHVSINPKDYLSTDTLKKVAPKGIDSKVSVYDILDMFYKFKTNSIGVSNFAITTAELRNHSSLDFKRLFFIRHEDNSYSFRASMALYIQRKLHDQNGPFQFMAFSNFIEAPMDIEEYIRKTMVLTVTKPLSVVKKDKAIISKYRKYLNQFNKKGLYFELFAAIIKKYGLHDVGKIDLVEVKAFAKEIRLSEDPVIKQTAEQKKNRTENRVMVATESETVSKKKNLAKLKKEKQILPYRTLCIRKYITDNSLSTAKKWDIDQTDFRLRDIKTTDLGDIKGTVVYASTEDRVLLLSVAYMYLLSINKSKKNTLSLYEVPNDDVFFIQIAKDNVKFFKEIPGSMDVKTYVKQEHSVDDGKLKIKFGDTVKNFMTGLYLHKLINLNPVNRALNSSIFINHMKDAVGKENITMMEVAHNILEAFPVPQQYEDSEDSMVNIKGNFKDVLRQDDTAIDSLMDSLYGLSEIQNLPVEGLPDKQKAIVQKFDEVYIDVFDKNFIDSLYQELLKYREVMELVLLRYTVQASNLQYDKTNLFNLLDTQIQEKLVSL